MGSAGLWLAVCGAAMVLALTGGLSIGQYRSPVEIENVYVALVTGEVFFVLLLWPLFEIRSGASVGSLLRGIVHVAGLMILAAPLVVLASKTVRLEWATVARSECFVLVLGIAVGAALRLPKAASWYYPIVFVLSGVVPMMAYSLREFGGVHAVWEPELSPFWAAGRLAAGGVSGAPFLIFGAMGAAGVVAVCVRASNATSR